MGLDAIRNVDADVRHVVLLSDGKSRSGTEDAFLVKLVTEPAGSDDVSTIAVGNDTDTPLSPRRSRRRVAADITSPTRLRKYQR